MTFSYVLPEILKNPLHNSSPECHPPCATRVFWYGGELVKVSRYCHFVPLDEGHVAAYNARTGSYLVVSERCSQALRAPRFAADSVTLGERFILSEFGFILDEREDELQMIRGQMFQTRYRD